MSLNKDTFYTLLIKIPTLLLNFISSIFLARWLLAEGRGLYHYLTFNADAAALLLGLNLPAGLAYFFAKQNIDREKLFGLTFVITLFATCSFALLITALFYTQAAPLHFFIPEAYSDKALIAFFLASYFFLNFSNTIYTSILQGSIQFKTMNTAALVLRVIALVGYGGVYFLELANILTLSLSYKLAFILVIHALSYLTYTFLFLKTVPFQLSLRFSFSKDIKPFFSYLNITYIAIIIHFINRRLDIFFIEQYRTNGTEELGHYAIATMFTDMILLITTAIPQVLLPYLTRLGKQEGRVHFLFFSRLNTAILLVLSLGVFVCSGWVIPLLYGEEFALSVTPMRILCVAVFFNGIRNLFTNYNFAFHRLKHDLYGNLSGLVFTLPLCLWLIPQYGPIGAAWATLGAYTANFVYLWVTLIPDVKANWRELFVLNRADIERLKGMIR